MCQKHLTPTRGSKIFVGIQKPATQAASGKQTPQQLILTTVGLFQTFCWQCFTAPHCDAVRRLWHHTSGPFAQSFCHTTGLATAAGERSVGSVAPRNDLHFQASRLMPYHLITNSIRPLQFTNTFKSPSSHRTTGSRETSPCRKPRWGQRAAAPVLAVTSSSKAAAASRL